MFPDWGNGGWSKWGDKCGEDVRGPGKGVEASGAGGETEGVSGDTSPLGVVDMGVGSNYRVRPGSRESSKIFLWLGLEC